MNKAVKKPVVVEYIQLTTKNIMEVYMILHPDEGKPDTSTLIASNKWDSYEKLVRDVGMNMFTLESGKGTQVASINDYIIKGVQGEYYPCKPDIFELTYDKLK